MTGGVRGSCAELSEMPATSAGMAGRGAGMTGGARGPCAELSEIPAASAGMTEKGRGYDGGCAGLLCRTQRDTRGERGYDGEGARV